MTIAKLFVISALLFLALPVRAGVDGIIPDIGSAHLTPGFYNQAIDHFDASVAGTFQQRYWVDSQFALAADAPVLLRLSGETDAKFILDDATNFFAGKLHARVVYLEHRYYGTSQPFSDQSTAHLKQLTVSQVIADTASFQTWLTQGNGWTGKWIVLGGSYSGTLAALYRLQHPELVVGALASSAPMRLVPTITDNSDETAAAVASIQSADYEGDGSRAWLYQACTGLGMWQNASALPSADLILPGAELCHRVFGSGLQHEPSPLATSDNSQLSHILFTYGGADPWTKAALIQNSALNHSVAFQLIDQAGHHFDLNHIEPGDSMAVTQARNRFLALATTWLKTI